MSTCIGEAFWSPSPFLPPAYLPWLTGEEPGASSVIGAYLLLSSLTGSVSILATAARLILAAALAYTPAFPVALLPQPAAELCPLL